MIPTLTAGHRLLLVALFFTSLLQVATATKTFPRRIAPDDHRAFQPLDQLLSGPGTDVEAIDPATVGKIRALHQHARRSRTRAGVLHSSHHHPDVIARRQVNAREAAKRWDEKHNKKHVAPRQQASAVSCLGTATSYGQCAGIGFTTTCCATGWTCTYVDSYYSQCQPAASSCTNAFYDQCGGLTWKGATCCPAGSSCEADGSYYSQCIPGAAATTSTLLATATSTSVLTSTLKTTSTALATSTILSTTHTTSTVIATSTSTSTEKTTSVVTSTSVVVVTSSPKATSTSVVVVTSTPKTTSTSVQVVTSTAKTTSTTATSTAKTTSASTTATAKTTSTTSSSTKASSTTTSSVKATATVAACSNFAWGECGGALWLGVTCCPTGYTCVASSIWYSQCLPS